MADEVISFWWKMEDDEIAIYTEKKTKMKYKGEPMAEYFSGLAAKPFAKQYKVRMGSIEQKMIFQELGLKEDDELKPPRKKRSTQKE